MRIVSTNNIDTVSRKRKVDKSYKTAGGKRIDDDDYDYRCEIYRPDR